MKEITKASAAKNSIWKLLESFLSKGVSMLVSIVLARILLPDDYGIIAFTSVFINLSDTLIQAGFSTALIRKEKVDEKDYSTVLGISIIMAFFLYIVIFLSAPIISNFYNEPLLVNVLRVIALSLFFQAFASVRTAIVSREMKFRVLFICSTVSNVLSGIVGIAIAYLGFGVWALVIQQLAQQFILTVSLFIAVKMKVKFKIYKESAKELVPFSIKVLTSSLLSFFSGSICNLVVGKTHSMTDLGYYEKGALFPQNISLYTFSAVSNVFLPVFTSVQNDRERLSNVFQRVLNVSMYIILPMMAGLCMVAEPLISVVLTDKWLPATWILRWSCLYYVMTPMLLAHVQLHFAIGKSDTRIKVEFYKLIITILALVGLFFTKLSINYVAAVMALIQVSTVVLITIETKKAIGFDILLMVKNLSKTIIAMLIMTVVVFAVGRIEMTNFLKLILEILAGGVAYLAASVVLRASAFSEIIGLIKSVRERG
mgnify:FL=1|jgi:teichuronic acid exporter